MCIRMYVFIFEITLYVYSAVTVMCGSSVLLHFILMEFM